MPNVSYSNLICFASGALIDTDRGPVAVDGLTPGDTVLTRDHGFQTIRWIGRRKLSQAELRAAPELRPIRIRFQSLGNGLPLQDFCVSPQHRVLVQSPIVNRMFAVGEVLVAANHLLCLDGVEIVEDEGEVEYFHLLFDHHEIIYANGAPTESLFTGPVAMRSLSTEARAEVLKLFPELMYMTELPRPVRKCVGGRKGRQLAQRHSKNRKALVTTAAANRYGQIGRGADG